MKITVAEFEARRRHLKYHYEVEGSVFLCAVESKTTFLFRLNIRYASFSNESSSITHWRVPLMEILQEGTGNSLLQYIMDELKAGIGYSPGPRALTLRPAPFEAEHFETHVPVSIGANGYMEIAYLPIIRKELQLEDLWTPRTSLHQTAQ